MHEIRIAHDMSEIVISAAERADASIVTRVNIKIGQLIQVVPEILEQAFRESVRGSVAEDAKLYVTILPVRIVCSVCRKESTLDDMEFICSYCNSLELDITQGKELFIESIETETP